MSDYKVLKCIELFCGKCLVYNLSVEGFWSSDQVCSRFDADTNTGDVDGGEDIGTTKFGPVVFAPKQSASVIYSDIDLVKDWVKTEDINGYQSI